MEFISFGIYKLESSEQDTLKKIFNEKYTIGGCEQTLLDFYSKNSRDPEKIQKETLFYLREFQDVYQSYDSADTKSKLVKKIQFMKKTIDEHPKQTRYLVPYLCDMGKNGGRKKWWSKIFIS